MQRLTANRGASVASDPLGKSGSERGSQKGSIYVQVVRESGHFGSFCLVPPFGAKTLRVLTAFPPRVLTNFPLRVLTAFSVRVLAAFRAVEKKRFIEDVRGPSPRAFNSGPKGPRGGPGAQGAPGGGHLPADGGPNPGPWGLWGAHAPYGLPAPAPSPCT